MTQCLTALKINIKVKAAIMGRFYFAPHFHYFAHMGADKEVFPVLITERLALVETAPAHSAALFRMFTNEQITRFYTVHPFNTESDLLPVIALFKTRFAEKNGIRWAITLKGRKELVGTIGYQSYIPGHKGTIVFALMPEYQNKGLITDAIKAVLNYGFEELGLKRIDAEVMVGNTASEHVLIKNGFKREVLLRQWLYWNGRHYDMNMYANIRQ